MTRLLMALAVGAITSGVARAQTVEIYAAGSLRAVVAATVEGGRQPPSISR